MVKPEWGTKRSCPKCSTRFYDLTKDEPVTCISCGNSWLPEPVLKSKQPLPVGTRVNLRFTVIMDDIETIEGTGEVVRVESDPAGMGVVFRELTSYSQNLIDKLLTLKS